MNIVCLFIRLCKAVRIHYTFILSFSWTAYIIWFCIYTYRSCCSLSYVCASVSVSHSFWSCLIIPVLLSFPEAPLRFITYSLSLWTLLIWWSIYLYFRFPTYPFLFLHLSSHLSCLPSSISPFICVSSHLTVPWSSPPLSFYPCPFIALGFLTFDKHPHEVGKCEVVESNEEPAAHGDSDEALREDANEGNGWGKGRGDRMKMRRKRDKEKEWRCVGSHEENKRMRASKRKRKRKRARTKTVSSKTRRNTRKK